MNYQFFQHNFDRLIGKDLRRIDGGNGVFRDVYRIQTNRFGSQYRGKVVKIGQDSSGVKANSAEFRTWMAVKGTEAEEHFSPVRDRSQNFEFLVMDYADPSGINYEDIREFRNEITEILGSIDVPVDEQVSMDIKSTNVGHHKHKNMVMIDYPWGGKFE